MVSEQKNVSEEQGGEARPAGEQSVDELLGQHVGHWQRRVQVIVAVVLVFLLYMVWFMMQE